MMLIMISDTTSEIAANATRTRVIPSMMLPVISVMELARSV